MNKTRTIRLAVAGFTLLGLSAVGLSSANADQTPKTKITVAQADAIVLKKYKTGKVQGKRALENEDKKWQYAVIVKADGKLHEVMVDASTGKIGSEEIVTPKEEATEKKADAAAKKTGKAKKTSNKTSTEAGEKK